jgi:Phage tail sheath C-terminal domain
VTNNEQGRSVFRSAVIEYMDALQGLGAIEDFETDDIQVHAGTDKDTLVAEMQVKPTDAMEKLYMTVTVE